MLDIYISGILRDKTMENKSIFYHNKQLLSRLQLLIEKVGPTKQDSIKVPKVLIVNEF